MPGELTDGWIFGYGSLVWRPSFAYDERCPAVLPGYSRRFWQGSTDHRGVPGAPGRVVTLVPEAGARCVGVAYLPRAVERAAILAALDHREKGGYERRVVRLELPTEGRVLERALVYVAAPDNPEHLGEASLSEMVAHIRRARGPSGDNVDYVYRLAEALRELGAEDDHVFGLERALRAASTELA